MARNRSRKIRARREAIPTAGRGVILKPGELRDPAPLKNPLMQRAILGRRVEAVRFASDNPVGNATADDLPSVPPGSSMAETDKPPWE
jgi:hypothetical protein